MLSSVQLLNYYSQIHLKTCNTNKNLTKAVQYQYKILFPHSVSKQTKLCKFIRPIKKKLNKILQTYMNIMKILRLKFIKDMLKKYRLEIKCSKQQQDCIGEANKSITMH